MRVKTFKGRSLEELLPGIREDLGPNAVVLSTRPLIAGGVGGFFGKRMVEITASDRMPNDDELIDLEQQWGGGEEGDAQAETALQLPQRATATAIAEPGGLDLVDDWDPTADDELAAEFGSLGDSLAKARATVDGAGTGRPNTYSASGSRPARTPHPDIIEDDEVVEETAGGASGGYRPLDLPKRSATVSASDLANAFAEAEVARVARESHPAEQARELAVRAHHAIAEATREIESQLAESRARNRGRSAPTAEHGATASPVSTFRAEVSAAPQRPQVSFPTPQQAADSDLAQHGDDVLAQATRPAQAPAARTGTAATGTPSTGSLPATDALALELRSALCSTGVDVDVAEAIVHRLIVHRLPFVNPGEIRSALRDVISDAVRTETGWSPLGRMHKMAVVGPSGAGKSSLVAKIAESYSTVEGCSVGVISIVVGAETHGTDPLLRRGGDLDVRFAADPEQVLNALDRLRECDVVLFDTPSAAYLDSEAASQVRACLAVAGIDDVHVVVPLATSVREVESVIEHFRGFNVNRMIVTKLDESRYAGQLLNFGFRCSLPITFLSDGPRIPTDLRAASSSEIAALIVPPTHQSE